jgi:5'-nucleotidase
MDASAISRKTFISHTAWLAAGTLLSSLPKALFAADAIKLTLLHTNDWHSRIEPFGADSGNLKGQGGAAVRAALIKKIRSEEQHVLLVDAGDIFQGTPYFNMYGGELEFKLMSAMQYDAATLGNHDFDAGVEGLVKQLPHATFPFINCNYDFSDSPLNGKVKPYLIVQKGPLKIGITGIGIELEGLVGKAMYGDIRYQHPLAPVNKMAKWLKHDQKCNLVVCLSHIGYKYETNKISDIVLAKESENIDVIIGGHTHTFLDQPDVLQNKNGKPVVVNQVGWAGLQLGRLDFHFSPRKHGTFEVSASRYSISENNT